MSLLKISLTLVVFGFLIFGGNHVKQSKESALFISDYSSTKELNNMTSKTMSNKEAMGTFSPNGPPFEPPIKFEVGKDCIVDLVQTYSVIGTLSGTFKIDYRILVFGPCGVPPGTYDEEWIAHGTFDGKINEISVSGNLSYLAKVEAGGQVDGHIIFGQGLSGELKVQGNFKDGKLSYTGWID